ncbi:MAG: EpsI family protein [Candidatus Omnitrophica bacterium]|nr:EpsI family protein [Candidatus Omnitrophota bacterium]
MLKINQPYLGLVAILGLLAFFPLDMPSSFVIDEALSPLFESFPMNIGGWHGKDFPVDERTYEILETRNVLSRLYIHPDGREIHLFIVGSRRDRRVAHPPEVCYTGSNFVILNEADGSLKIGNKVLPVREFTAQNERNPSAREEVLYLYKIGDRYTTNYYAQQLRFALDRFTRKDSEVFLIRLAGRDKSVFKEFLEALLPLL